MASDARVIGAEESPSRRLLFCYYFAMIEERKFLDDLPGVAENRNPRRDGF